jgi:tetratricopeptide (TPR) repeat protein
MYQRESHLQNITRFLSRLKYEVELRNSINLYDINIHAEYFYQDLLNLVYGLELKNLNTLTKNTAHIDLIDEKNKKAIQVTSQNDNGKIKGAIEGFFSNADNAEFDLKVLLIAKSAKDYRTDFTNNGKYKFDHEKDVIDIERLLAEIRNKDTEELDKISVFLAKEEIKLTQLSETPIPKFIPIDFPSRLAYFTGRGKVLENITNSLEKYGTSSLADTHGVGKSSIVNEFAHLNQANYKHILFIRATKGEFDISVSKILQSLKIDLPDDAKPEQRMFFLQQWLAENQDWLLLVDNVEDVAFTQSCNFNKPTGKVIYTANDSQIYKIGTKIELPRMSDENAMLLLYKHWQDSPDAKLEDILENYQQTLKDIAQKFGNHPFSMAFVGSYLTEEQENLDEFLETYQSKQVNLLKNYSFLSNYQHKEVATAFLLRFEQISTPKDDSEREKFLAVAVIEYLKLSAFIGTDNIPEELLQESLALLYPEQHKFTLNKEFIRDIYKRFKPTSIFRRDSDKKTLTTHRIIQEVIYPQAIRNRKLLVDAIALIIVKNWTFVDFENKRFNFANKEMVDIYLPHISIFLKSLEKKSPNPNNKLKQESIPVGYVCNLYAQYLKEFGEYPEAAKYFKIFNRICEKYKDDDPNLLAVSYGSLARVYCEMGEYKDSEFFYQKALAIFLEIYDENHLNIAATYNNLGLLYRVQGRYKETENLYFKSLTISEKINGEFHIVTAQSYNNLAELYRIQKKHNQAEPLYRKSLKIREKLLGKNDVYTAESYNNLGLLYQQQAKYKEAEPLMIKAISIWENFLGINHPDTATAYNNLAMIYDAQNNYKEAEPLYKKCLKIRKKMLGENHPETGTSYNNLGVLYFRCKRFSEARYWLEKALSIYKQVLGESHPFTIETQKDYKNLQTVRLIENMEINDSKFTGHYKK